MFGHQDDHDDKPAPEDNGAAPDTAVQEPSNEGNDKPDQPANDSAATPEPDATLVKPDPPAPTPGADAAVSTAQSPADGPAWQHPGAPLGNDQDNIKDIISPAGGFPKRPTYQYPVPGAATSAGPTSLDDNSDDPATHELIDIKQHALGELAPLIDKLDLPPEEKFRTIMMMIQASDDETMVKAAYAAAHSIEDEKIRAQALLDIINEVNYFTQPPEN